MNVFQKKEKKKKKKRLFLKKIHELYSIQKKNPLVFNSVFLGKILSFCFALQGQSLGGYLHERDNPFNAKATFVQSTIM